MSSDLDILAFSAHPDDVEFGCGGALIQAVDRGLSVGIADLTEGERSTRGTPALRAEEKATASEILGVSERFSVGLADTEIGFSPTDREPVIELIRATRPTVVIAPHIEDRHPDHAAAGELIFNACFYGGVGKIGAGEPHRPARLFFYMMHRPFAPTFVVDVSAEWDRKMAALKAYRTQFGAEGSDPATAIAHRDFMGVVEARATWFGAMIGAAHGEPFLSPGPLAAGLGDVMPRAAEGSPRYRMY